MEVRTALLDEPENGLTDEIPEEYGRPHLGGATARITRCQDLTVDASTTASTRAWACSSCTAGTFPRSSVS